MRDAAAALDHVHYLNNDVYVDPAGRFRVLGTTLWTDFELFGNDAAALSQSIAACERVMLDFKGLIQVDWPGGADASSGESSGASREALRDAAAECAPNASPEESAARRAMQTPAGASAPPQRRTHRRRARATSRRATRSRCIAPLARGSSASSRNRGRARRSSSRTTRRCARASLRAMPTISRRPASSAISRRSCGRPSRYGFTAIRIRRSTTRPHKARASSAIRMAIFAGAPASGKTRLSNGARSSRSRDAGARSTGHLRSAQSTVRRPSRCGRRVRMRTGTGARRCCASIARNSSRDAAIPIAPNSASAPKPISKGVFIDCSPIRRLR
ncbi:calcineurin-like phosphoesterase [Burkholderia pseudomallei]|nr:calcineurin-like phosphoesterase [Burkholderia pseudomallei]